MLVCACWLCRSADDDELQDAFALLAEAPGYGPAFWRALSTVVRKGRR